MIDILKEIVNFIETSGAVGALIGCLFILIESIVPVLPLMVFITINFLVFGNLLGFILSWIFTILGCIMSYFIFKKGFGNKFENLTEDKELLKKYKKIFKNITVSQLTILIAIPFTPAFMINIAAGLVKMDFKKYFTALLIGKISLVYFWGFVGTSFIESMSNPIILIKIFTLLVITYIISVIVNKILKIK
ncbi:MAG: VTT domain-containing protein [Tenericutes bacterium]|nr:VTT domain-containing protein [Mycoplasmatota bacterium]